MDEVQVSYIIFLISVFAFSKWLVVVFGEGLVVVVIGKDDDIVVVEIIAFEGLGDVAYSFIYVGYYGCVFSAGYVVYGAVAVQVFTRGLQGCVDRLEGYVEEEGLSGVVVGQDVVDTLGIEYSGVLVVEFLGYIFIFMQVEVIYFWVIIVVIGVVVYIVRERVQEGVKVSTGGQVFFSVEVQVLFVYYVGGVICFLQFLGQCYLVQGQVVGLSWADDGVLEVCVDLVFGGRRGGYLNYFIKFLFF